MRRTRMMTKTMMKTTMMMKIKAVNILRKSILSTMLKLTTTKVAS